MRSVRTLAGLAALLATLSAGAVSAEAQVVCKNDDLCVEFLPVGNPRFAHFRLAGLVLTNTKYNLREGASQREFRFGEVRFFPRYGSISLQRCTTDVFGNTIRCTAWASFTAPSLSSTSQPLNVQGVCKNGWVWRDARPGDRVCVRPVERDRALQQNAQGPRFRVSPTSTTCIPGYVWRQAFVGDAVCVTPAERSRAFKQNADSPMFVRR